MFIEKMSGLHVVHFDALAPIAAGHPPISMAGAILAFVAAMFLLHWLHWYCLRRALNAPISRDRAGRAPVLMPEALCHVTLDETGITCTKPKHPPEHVSWATLRTVEIHTNDSGPWGTDVWFVLRGERGACAVPQGATGESVLLEKLQTLPGFDNKALMDAMRSTDNHVFHCWTRPDDKGATANNLDDEGA